jgi:DNA mismatch repair protein MutS
VIERSEVILQTLEADHQDSTGKTTIPQRKRRSKHKQLTLFGPEYHPLLDELRALDMDHMTPTGAFEALQKLRSRLGAR